MKTCRKKSVVCISSFLLLLASASSSAQPDGAAGATGYVEPQPDGVAGATGYAEPAGPEQYATEYESELLSGTYQLITDSLRSGEGYFLF